MVIYFKRVTMVRKRKGKEKPWGERSEDIDRADDELINGGQKRWMRERRENERKRAPGLGKRELKREGTEVGHERTGGASMRVILVGGHPLAHFASRANKQAPGLRSGLSR